MFNDFTKRKAIFIYKLYVNYYYNLINKIIKPS